MQRPTVRHNTPEWCYLVANYEAVKLHVTDLWYLKSIRRPNAIDLCCKQGDNTPRDLLVLLRGQSLSHNNQRSWLMPLRGKSWGRDIPRWWIDLRVRRDNHEAVVLHVINSCYSTLEDSPEATILLMGYAPYFYGSVCTSMERLKRDYTSPGPLLEIDYFT
jgi:hypothetical protein